MTLKVLEARVAQLERQLAELRTRINGQGEPQQEDWRNTFGMFTGDETMREIFAEALKFREADRKRARGRVKSVRRSKAKA